MPETAVVAVVFLPTVAGGLTDYAVDGMVASWVRVVVGTHDQGVLRHRATVAADEQWNKHQRAYDQTSHEELLTWLT
jgi:hypothetical protein